MIEAQFQAGVADLMAKAESADTTKLAASAAKCSIIHVRSIRIESRPRRPFWKSRDLLWRGGKGARPNIRDHHERLRLQ
jgi:hypothetical protein